MTEMLQLVFVQNIYTILHGFLYQEDTIAIWQRAGAAAGRGQLSAAVCTEQLAGTATLHLHASTPSSTKLSGEYKWNVTIIF